jgi:hypothetical protein
MGALKVRSGGAWVDVGVGGGPLPPGGVLGDILVKQSATLSDAIWDTALPKLWLTDSTIISASSLVHALTIGQANRLMLAPQAIQARTAAGANIALNLNTWGGEVAIGGGDTLLTPPGLMIYESAHAASRRAKIGIGLGWEIGQDWNATGVKDLFIYNRPNSRLALYINNLGLIATLAGSLQLGGLAGPQIKSDGTYVHLDSKGAIYYDGNNHYWRTVGGAAASMTMDASRLNAVRGITSSYESPDYYWSSGHFLAYPTSSSNAQARLTLHSPGSAPQLACAGVDGERVKCVNGVITGYVPILASAFTVSSSITMKREVRPLREHVAPIVVRDPRDDIVAVPDVMSLRPVVFRPKVPMLRIAPLDGDDEYTTERYQMVPQDGILGHEGTRERLGLIAEQVESVLPSAVDHNADGEVLGIDYAQVTVALLDHVQQLTKRIEMLEALL